MSAAMVGGGLMVASAALFLLILVRGQRGARVVLPPYRFSVALHPAADVPKVLNGFATWVVLMIALTLANYGVPILQLLAAKTSVPAVYDFNR